MFLFFILSVFQLMSSHGFQAEVSNSTSSVPPEDAEASTGSGQEQWQPEPQLIEFEAPMGW